MLGRDFTQRREHRLNEEFPGTRYSRTHMPMVIRQALIKHDAIAQRHFFFEFLKLSFVACHFLSPFLTKK